MVVLSADGLVVGVFKSCGMVGRAVGVVVVGVGVGIVVGADRVISSGVIVEEGVPSPLLVPLPLPLGANKMTATAVTTGTANRRRHFAGWHRCHIREHWSR